MITNPQTTFIAARSGLPLHVAGGRCARPSGLAAEYGCAELRDPHPDRVNFSDASPRAHASRSTSTHTRLDRAERPGRPGTSRIGPSPGPCGCPGREEDDAPGRVCKARLALVLPPLTSRAVAPGVSQEHAPTLDYQPVAPQHPVQPPSGRRLPRRRTCSPAGAVAASPRRCRARWRRRGWVASPRTPHGSLSRARACTRCEDWLGVVPTPLNDVIVLGPGRGRINRPPTPTHDRHWCIRGAWS